MKRRAIIGVDHDPFRHAIPPYRDANVRGLLGLARDATRGEISSALILLGLRVTASADEVEAALRRATPAHRPAAEPVRITRSSRYERPLPIAAPNRQRWRQT